MEKQYIVIKHRHHDSLSERVSEAMNQGYVPWGNLFFNEDQCHYVQAMVKKTEVIGNSTITYER